MLSSMSWGGATIEAALVYQKSESESNFIITSLVMLQAFSIQKDVNRLHRDLLYKNKWGSRQFTATVVKDTSEVKKK